MEVPNAFINGFNGISQTKLENGNRTELNLKIYLKTYREHGEDHVKYTSTASFQKLKINPVTLAISPIGQPEQVPFDDCAIY